MRRPTRFLATLATGCAVAFAPAPSMAAESEIMDTLEPAFAAWRGAVDVVVLRPLGTVRLLTGMFVGLPFSVTFNALAWPIDRDTNTKVFEDDWELYVVEPWQYTFEREVGEELTGV